MNNELLAALIASAMTFGFGWISGHIEEKRQSSKIIKKAKTYVNDELDIIRPILVEIDNVLSNNNNPPVQKIQSLNRFVDPSEALKNQIVELPEEDLRKKINQFYNDLFHAVHTDFSRLYSLGNEQDPLIINDRNDIKNKFKELVKALDDIQPQLK